MGWAISAIVSGILAVFLELFRIEWKSRPRLIRRREFSSHILASIFGIWTIIAALAALEVI